ncbi:MAG: AAA family ATPase, partial [Chloroflexota bacterium]
VEEEDAMLLRFERSDPLETLQPVTDAEQILALQRQVRTVRVEASVRRYIVSIARATRGYAGITLGVSPRGTLALYHTAQAWAALHGREFVIPDDVKFLAPYVLTHRVLIDPQARLRGRQPHELMADIVETVPVPVEQ